jgi:hypothetical protein
MQYLCISPTDICPNRLTTTALLQSVPRSHPETVSSTAGTTSGIFIYAINSDGSITVQNGGNIAAQDVVPTAMQVDSTGGYLLAAGVSTLVYLPGHRHLSN